MGLDQFNVAPDNKGGRPEGSKEDRGYSTRDDDYGEAMTIEHGEEYLEKLLDMFVEGEEPTREEMAEMCDYAHLLPRSLKIEFDKHGILDYPESRFKKKTLGSPAKEDSNEEKSGGLFSVINKNT